MGLAVIFGSIIIMVICVVGGYQWGYDKGRQHEKLLQETLQNLRNHRG